MALGERERFMRTACHSNELPYDIRTALVLNIAAHMKCLKDCPWIGQAFVTSTPQCTDDWKCVGTGSGVGGRQHDRGRRHVSMVLRLKSTILTLM
jgi:hypothetical protein